MGGGVEAGGGGVEAGGVCVEAGGVVWRQGGVVWKKGGGGGGRVCVWGGRGWWCGEELVRNWSATLHRSG